MHTDEPPKASRTRKTRASASLQASEASGLRFLGRGPTRRLSVVRGWTPPEPPGHVKYEQMSLPEPQTLVKHDKSSPPEPQTLRKIDRSSLPEPESSIYSSYPAQINSCPLHANSESGNMLAQSPTTLPLPTHTIPRWVGGSGGSP